ncbi:hypothetical protein E2C01_041869 [Portunus trituberculatus]|uniref:Uncharacterized protein n=1 Tax=Portunus trituberculatus TaxID=210409 RepID=A0A5B7FUW4_PORTR|nr:hypothetical protein [Portunus trituberculatus]
MVVVVVLLPKTGPDGEWHQFLWNLRELFSGMKVVWVGVVVTIIVDDDDVENGDDDDDDDDRHYHHHQQQHHCTVLVTSPSGTGPAPFTASQHHGLAHRF